MRDGNFYNYVKTELRMTNHSNIFMHSFLLLKYIVHKNFSFKLGISRRIRYLCEYSCLDSGHQGQWIWVDRVLAKWGPLGNQVAQLFVPFRFCTRKTHSHYCHWHFWPIIRRACVFVTETVTLSRANWPESRASTGNRTLLSQIEKGNQKVRNI